MNFMKYFASKFATFFLGGFSVNSLISHFLYDADFEHELLPRLEGMGECFLIGRRHRAHECKF